MKNILALFLVCLFFIASGCTGYRPTIEEAQADGAEQLGKQNLKDLVMNRELQMVSWDKSIEAMIQFNRNGTLTGSNSVGETSTGHWSATADNELCLKFKNWDDNRNRCYTIFKSGNQYLMFHSGSMENTLIPSEDALSTLADMNVGILGSPPPTKSRKPAKKIPTPAPEIQPVASNGSLLSTLTFGLLGNDAEEQQVQELPYKNEFIPQPMVQAKKLSIANQQLIDTGDCEECDLKGVDLKGMNLKGANLAGADLTGANLQEANLKGANLKGTNLESARLTDAILTNADLQGANLSDANLHWADLSKADLRGANLTRCYMVKATFYKADLTGADLSGAQTQRAIFEKAEGVPDHILNSTKDDDSVQ